MTELNEPILPDDFPVYAGFLYVADYGINQDIIQSDINGTIKDLKACFGVKNIRRCDIVGRHAIVKESSQ